MRCHPIPTTNFYFLLTFPIGNVNTKVPADPRISNWYSNCVVAATTRRKPMTTNILTLWKLFPILLCAALFYYLNGFLYTSVEG